LLCYRTPVWRVFHRFHRFGTCCLARKWKKSQVWATLKQKCFVDLVY
jgi:hypothetical protein